MNIMLFSLLLYSGTFEHSDAHVRTVVHIVLWALATPAVLILGWPLFREALHAVIHRRPGSAALISLGVGGAYGFSTYAVIMDERQVYFRSEEHTSELQSLMRISYAVFCLK